MRNLTLPFLLVGAILLAGCGGGKKIAGTWVPDKVPADMPPGAKVTMTFTEPDQMVMKITADQEEGGMKMKFDVTVNGTYALTGNKLKITGTSSDIKIGGLPDNMKASMDAMIPDMKTKMLADLNKESDQVLEWKSDNEFVWKSAKGDTTFKRQ